MENRIIGKAIRDQSFRQALISNPRQAIEQELGIQIPSSIQIQVVEETQDKLVLPLPMVDAHPQAGPLSEQELGAVAGGGSWESCGDMLTCYGPTCKTDTGQGGSNCPCGG